MSGDELAEAEHYLRENVASLSYSTTSRSVHVLLAEYDARAARIAELKRDLADARDPKWREDFTPLDEAEWYLAHKASGDWRAHLTSEDVHNVRAELGSLRADLARADAVVSAARALVEASKSGSQTNVWIALDALAAAVREGDQR